MGPKIGFKPQRYFPDGAGKAIEGLELRLPNRRVCSNSAIENYRGAGKANKAGQQASTKARLWRRQQSNNCKTKLINGPTGRQAEFPIDASTIGD